MSHMQRPCRGASGLRRGASAGAGAEAQPMGYEWRKNTVPTGSKTDMKEQGAGNGDGAERGLQSSRHT